MMNRSFNFWWITPVITAVLGVLCALMLTPKNNHIIDNEQAHLEPAPLIITPVSLPPEPKREPSVSKAAYASSLASKNNNQALLTAKIHNEQVVLKQEELSEEDNKPYNNQVNSDDSSLNSSTLAAQLNQAMQDIADEEKLPKKDAKLHAYALHHHPQWYQDLVVPLDFSTHIYATEKHERWVRVNDQVVHEGELINSQMRLVAIEPQQVVIEMLDRQFTLPALVNR